MNSSLSSRQARPFPAQRVLARLLPLLARAAVAVIIIALLVPVVVVILLSFSAESFIQFPPKAWGFRQYAAITQSDVWIDAVLLSVKVAAPSAAIAVVVGTLAAFAITRTSMRGRSVIQALGLGSLIIPSSAYAVALYGVFEKLNLLGTFWGLVAIDSMLALPVVLLLVTAAIDQVPRQLELTAMSLGARRLRVGAEITLRLVAPSLVAATIFSFVLSFDESVFVIFLGGGLSTLPAAIYAAVTVGLDPVITAIASALMLATGLVLALGLIVRGKDR